jgi:hypothetical protein
MAQTKATGSGIGANPIFRPLFHYRPSGGATVPAPTVP